MRTHLTLNSELDAVLAYLDREARAQRDKARTFRRPRGGFSTNERFHDTQALALETAAKAIRNGEHKSCS